MSEERSLATVNGDSALTRPGFPSIFLNMDRFAAAQRVGQMLSDSTLVPDHFRKNLGNCVIALNLAERLNVDPFMLMQAMYVVHGRPGIEGKLVIALIEGTGRFSPLQYKLEGAGKTAKNIDRPESCTAYATDLKTGQVVEGPPVTWAMAEAERWTADKGQGQSSKWQTLPGLMFRYRAATFFARVHCPGALMGLRTQEELEDIVDLQQVSPGTYEAPPPPDPPDESAEEKKREAVASFDSQIPEGTDSKDLDRYLKVCATHFKKTVDEVKASAAGNMGEFVKAFDNWNKARKKKPGAPGNGGDPKGGVNKAPDPAPAEASQGAAQEAAPEAKGESWKCPFLDAPDTALKTICNKECDPDARADCPIYSTAK